MGVISLEHSDRLYWLGRYMERTFTTLKTIEQHYDGMLDGSLESYKKYLECLKISGEFESVRGFVDDFVFDKGNINSVAHSLARAYDNGIVLREDISTEALAYIQIAMDKLEKIRHSEKAVRFELIYVEDIIFSFWGCMYDYMDDEEKRDLILVGKSMERLDLYFRFNYPAASIEFEFNKLCKRLDRLPANTPYRYNKQFLEALKEISSMKDYTERKRDALSCLANLFNAA